MSGASPWCRARRRAGVVAALFGLFSAQSVVAQTSQGELEGRPAPVALRRCLAGSNVGALCNENSDCPGSSCKDRNIFNVSVAVHFNATPAQLTAIQNAISAGSATLFDVTDGQAEIGLATIHNNAFGTTNADFRIFPASSPTWWNANTGNWRVGGSVNVSIDNIQAAGAPGESMAHEFLHLAFDPRDEYESRPVGCPGGATTSDSCPISGSGGTNCIMDAGGTGTEGQFSELCWGQGDTAAPTDFSAGNHDADDTTEQSRCRSNRSCWDQVVWSYPNTMKKPAGAPDPTANGATVDPTNFVVVNNTSRVVLVLDQSGSMALESPARMERLRVAANDFIALAENGVELGIVSFATNVVQELAIAPLGANRTAWTNVVSGLTPTTRTNIGAGLDRARTLINNAGGVTGNTFVVLMTDGLNNEPGSAAAATLQAAVAQLQADGIEVHVTCTGGDLGLQSQCSEIATGTGGLYVDSADASKLPPSFAEIAARGFGHEMIGEQSADRVKILGGAAERYSSRLSARSAGGSAEALSTSIGKALAPWLAKSAAPNTHGFYVERGSANGLFTVQWPETNLQLSALLVSPSGATQRMRPMPQGLFANVPNPQQGVWRIRVAKPAGAPDSYTARAYSRNYVLNVGGGVRYASVRPGEPITFFAYPRAEGKALSTATGAIRALVTRPDGVSEFVDMSDKGRGEGDDVADDGVFTGVYKNTLARGAYSIAVFWTIDKWGRAVDAIGHTFGPKNAVGDVPDYVSPRLVRELRLVTAVIDPVKDKEERPDDPPPGQKPPRIDPTRGGVTAPVQQRPGVFVPSPTQPQQPGTTTNPQN